METPNNVAGRATEKVMAGFKSACLEQHPYNRMYEHVYRVLSKEFATIVAVHHAEPMAPLRLVIAIDEAFEGGNAHSDQWIENVRAAIRAAREGAR